MASTAEESTVSEDVAKLMGQGKRHLVCNEVVQAVKCFEEATQALDNKYGSGADECGEAYLFYGKALLELARAENGVLGNALKDVEPKSGESSDEDEEKMEAVGPKISEMSPNTKDKIRERVLDALAEKEEAAGTQDKGKDDKDENDEKSKDKGDEKMSGTDREGKDGSEQSKSKESAKEGADEEMKEGNANDKKENEEEGEDKGENNSEEKEENVEEEGEEQGEQDGEGNNGDAAAEGQEEDADIPTMQLAWEFLELARLVFVRHSNKEAQLNLAEVHLKLGEIQLEQEQFVGAEADYRKCLELQEKHLEPDNRLIAETAYSLGLAFSLQPNYAQAKEFYSKALSVIELKASRLEACLAESKGKGKGKATDDDPCVVDRKELEELQNLHPEIKARVDEAQEMMNAAVNQPVTTEECLGSSGHSSTDVPVNTIPLKKVPTGQPVNDVSHLIRRKRKPEEESGDKTTEDSEIPLKKARQDEEQQTAPVVNENGHTQS